MYVKVFNKMRNYKIDKTITIEFSGESGGTALAHLM